MTVTSELFQVNMFLLHHPVLLSFYLTFDLVGHGRCGQKDKN